MNKNQITDAIANEYKKIASDNFLLWQNALLSGSAEKVAELYAETATFLPTVSAEYKKGKSGAASYFKHFLEKNPSGSVVLDEVQVINTQNYVHSGFYNFEVGPSDNRQVLEARFTFVWVFDKYDQWKILHHHSSLKPTI